MDNLPVMMKIWLMELGLGESPAGVLNWIGLALIVGSVAWLSNALVKRIILAFLSYFVKHSKTKWDDAMLERRVFTRMSHLAPAMVIYFSANLLAPATSVLQRFSMVYMIGMALFVLFAFLDAGVDIYRSYPVAKNRPIKGYVQIAKIILSIFLGVMALATLLDRSPWLMLSGLGAMTAVLLLLFKDAILGLVASVQLSLNDMVAIGDWIAMPKYGADGDVIDVTLHTVKVQNWDKTITTIPSYALVSDSFKNWRGMDESGGRRIKRSLNLDMNSVHFSKAKDLDRYEKFQSITDYIKSTRKEVSAYNVEHKVDASELVNGRNMTNLGTFRAYMKAYLQAHPKIHQEMTLLVRHLQPTEHGLPFEIYVFSNDQDWINYEDIQADIFDHMLAVIPEFGLRVFQAPSGHDLRSLKE